MCGVITKTISLSVLSVETLLKSPPENRDVPEERHLHLGLDLVLLDEPRRDDRLPILHREVRAGLGAS
jgi:hypothetical protein